jgi:opacity protein-like surface antigen
MSSKHCLIAIAIAALVVPVWADSAEPLAENPGQEPLRQSAQPSGTATAQTTGHSTSYSTGSDIGWRGWGLRAGVADDVDQVVGGAHFNLGEFVPHLRFQPDVQLGSGDDHTTLYGTAPVYYRFGTETRFTPYAGGGVSMGFVDRDLPAGSNADDTDFEIGGKVTGGMEWPRPEGQAFFLELSLGFGDVHDAQFLVAWSF